MSPSPGARDDRNVSPENHQRASDLFNELLDVPERERQATLDAACVGNPALRSEVVRLLQAESGAGSFLKQHAIADAALLIRADGANLPTPGTVAHYKILSKLGEGGMGEVWRAFDSKLNREVAIKILPAAFAADPGRMARFSREAQVLASLNHPNIAAIYGVEDRALIMELVEGPTLAEHIAKGPISWEEGAEIATQIAAALEAAHEKAVVHRDLKPANIKVTPEGRVKVLDFGLAKAVGRDPISGNPASSPTFISQGTEPGLILGTAAYMSPEQAKGRPVDQRGDIWAFGVVLYKMFTGRDLFRGETVTDTLAEVLKSEPDLEPVPAPARPIVERCLRKDPRKRWQSVGDVRIAIEEALAGLTPPAKAQRPVPAYSSWTLRVALASGLVVGLGAGILVALALVPTEGVDLSRYKFTPLAREEAEESNPQWSPDGKNIAYQVSIHGLSQIFARGIDAPKAVELTHGTHASTKPFWSPDGLAVYYLSRGGLWSVEASGGEPQLVTNDVGPAAIHPGGKTWAFVRAGKLHVGTLIEAKEYRQEPFASQSNFLALQFSRDGSKLAVLLTARSGRPGELWILPFPSGIPRRVAQGAVISISWFPDNRRLLLTRAGPDGFRNVTLDSATGHERAIWINSAYLQSASVAPDGKRIAISEGANLSNLAEILPADGGVSTLLARGGTSFFPDWAPSGTHYLYASDASGRSAIEDRSAREDFARVLVTVGSESLPRTSKELAEPRWAPDGQRFLFGIGFGGNISRQIWVSNASGGRPFPIDPSAGSSTAACWSPDGGPNAGWIAYIRIQDGKGQLAKIRASAGASPIVLADAAASRVMQTHWSPSGDWILYPSAAGLSLVSPDGKLHRTLTTRKLSVYGFSKSGEQVIGVYHSPVPDAAEWELYSVDVRTGVEKRFAALNLPPNISDIVGFSFHPDGKRFATSIVRTPLDIWVLEGFENRKPMLERLKDAVAAW